MNIPGTGCSKLTTSFVNVSLKFQKLVSQIRQYFLLKKVEKLLSFFFQQYVKPTMLLKHIWDKNSETEKLHTSVIAI